MALGKCPECGGIVSSEAISCPHCGKGFKKAPAPQQTSGCAKIAAILIGVPLVISAIGMCSRSTTGESEPTKAKPASATAPAQAKPVPPPPAPGSQWIYRQSEDPMGGAVHQAATVSRNTVEFGFPYQGAQYGQLQLRTHPRYGKEVMVSIERGQILCRSYQECTLTVRFDDGSPQQFSAIGPADNSTETVFITNYSRFLASMQKARKVRVALPVYQQGEPTFEFDVSGFDVDRYLGKAAAAEPGDKGS